MGKPACGKFLATIRHVLAAEYAKCEHFLGREFRAKLGVEIAPHGHGKYITIAALHLVVYTYRF